MTVTVENVLSVPYRVVGNQKETVFDITFDSKYSPGGEIFPGSSIGLKNVIERGTCTIQKIGGTVNVANASFRSEVVGGVLFGAVELFDETPAEVASEADVSSIVVRLVARGI